MSVLLFWKRKKIKANFRIAMQWVVMFIVGFATLGLSLYCLYTLPIVDFRPYHVGANIAEGMIIPEDAPKPVVESKFIYEKNGNKQEFTAENAPTGDSEWTFVDAKHEIIDPGYIPPIHDFTIERTFFEEVPTVDPFDIELVFKNADGEQMYIDVSSIPDSSWHFENAICEACESEIDAANIAISYQNADGEIVTLGVNDPTNGQLEFIDAVYNSGSTAEKDITNQVLADERYSFLMIALNLENMDNEHLAEIDSIAKFANENNMGFYCLTHSDENAIAAFIEEYKPEYQFYNTDEITLKTIVRSNPGLLLIKKGTILGKWHDGNLPQVAELRNDLTAKMLTQQHNERNTYLYFVWILSTLFAMAFIGLVFNWLIRKRFINDNNNKI